MEVRDHRSAPEAHGAQLLHVQFVHVDEPEQAQVSAEITTIRSTKIAPRAARRAPPRGAAQCTMTSLLNRMTEIPQ